MKLTAVFLTLTIIFVCFGLKPLYAQGFDSEKAYQDYQYQLTVYQNDYAEYQSAVTFYKKNPTLQLQEEARKSTLKMLRDRDILITTYLTALRMQMVETKGFTADEKASLYSKIDPEVAWYQNHAASYQDGDELNTLFNKSDEGKKRYQAVTKIIFTESLLDNSLSTEIGLRLSHQAVYNELKSHLNDQVEKGKLRIDPFNRWLTAIDGVLVILAQNEANATKKISQINAQNFSLNQINTTTLEILKNSLISINQLNNYLNELLISIAAQSQ